MCRSMQIVSKAFILYKEMLKIGARRHMIDIDTKTVAIDVMDNIK